MGQRPLLQYGGRPSHCSYEQLWPQEQQSAQ